MQTRTMQYEMNIKPEHYRQAANAVTYGRLIGTSIVVGDIISAEKTHRRSYKRAGLFTFFALLDGLDGLIARRSGEPTPAGAQLDQEVDKVCTGATKTALAVAHKSPTPAVSLIIDVPRDYLVNQKRQELRDKGLQAGARPLGKLKTGINFATLIADLTPLGEKYPRARQAMYLGGMALTVVSGVEFMQAANVALEHHEAGTTLAEDTATAAQAYTRPELA